MMRNAKLSRRQFLSGAAGAGVAGAAAVAVAHNPIHRAFGHTDAPASKSAAGRPTSVPVGKGTLVLITLYGGNDGLNTVIPYADSAYLGGRPKLGYPPEQVLHLDKQLGLHPNLTGLKSLWDAKQLAVVLGVGYPQPNRSHFRSMDIWQSAIPETDEITGWLGRWLDTGVGDPLRALSLGPTLPKLLTGTKFSAGAVPSGNVTLPGGGGLTSAFTALEQVSAGEPPLAGRIAQSGADLLKVVHAVGDVLVNQPVTDIGSGVFETGGAVPAARPGVTAASRPGATVAGQPGTAAGPGTAPARSAGKGQLATQLDLVARLIKGGAPTQVYSVSLGGFDTHAGEKDDHARLMSELDAGIAGFLASLKDDRKGDDVVVMTYSEFGRRVSANASSGTDHGTAAPLFVSGRPVKGGFYGEQPSLSDLDHGDLKFSTDFRSVYATIMDKVLGVNPKDILMGKSFPSIPFISTR